MNRNEAITWLRSMGRNASARDWVMGETIAMTVGEPNVVGPDGLVVYPGIVYLYPSAAGAWHLYDCDLPDPAERYENLESAMRGAHEYVGRKESARLVRME